MASQNRGRGRGRFRRSREANGGDCKDQGKRAKTGAADVDESSSVIQAFRTIQQELDSKYDRHERIVKLSRDITIDSKKLIFLLQRVAGSEDRTALLAEAASKIQELHRTKLLALAKELDGQDPYQFLRAFSPGLQEYIEAVTFFHYLTDKQLVGRDKIQSQLKFTVQSTMFSPPSTSAKPLVCNTSDSTCTTSDKMSDPTKADAEEVSTTDNKKPQPGDQPKPSGKKDGMSLSPYEETVSSTSDLQSDFQTPGAGENEQTISVPILPSDYMLGMADFTGELMRMAINSVGAGDLDTPTIVAEMMRIIYDAFSTMGHTTREFRQKTRTLRQCLQKVETACYTLKVRGSEIPKHMLADVFTTTTTAVPGDSYMEDSEELYA